MVESFGELEGFARLGERARRDHDLLHPHVPPAAEDDVQVRVVVGLAVVLAAEHAVRQVRPDVDVSSFRWGVAAAHGGGRDARGFGPARVRRRWGGREPDTERVMDAGRQSARRRDAHTSLERLGFD